MIFVKKLISLALALIMALSCFSVISSAEEEKPLDYVVLGDSIAYGSGMINSIDACYGKIVAETNGYTYANHSIPGITSSVLLTMLTDGEKVRESVADADIISISIGGNNFLTDNIIGLAFDSLAKKDMSRFDEISALYYEDLCTIMDRINELNPDAVVLLQTIYNPQKGAAGVVYLEGGTKLNDMMRKYDAEHPGEIVIVEVAEALNGDYDNFADDKIHPSKKGNEKIAAVILDKLSEMGLGTATEPVISTPGLDFKMPISFAFIINVICELFALFSNLINPLK